MGVLLSADPAEALPASRPGLTLNMLAEGRAKMAYRSTAGADFYEPSGSTREFDQDDGLQRREAADEAPGWSHTRE